MQGVSRYNILLSWFPLLDLASTMRELQFVKLRKHGQRYIFKTVFVVLIPFLSGPLGTEIEAMTVYLKVFPLQVWHEILCHFLLLEACF